MIATHAPVTVGPTTLEDVTPVDLYGRMDGDTLLSLWAYDPHTDTHTSFHQGINITHEQWAEAQDRLRVIRALS